ncbi:Uncharacterized protein OBRU01_12490 [Operophtera brumata]|uniref:START domain-containing protein n=1 Tax=Operophtera brumata TaxID=104452 RepID=A0A0L7LA13_OPEBR|nr:Uncharacterized protein OBRU01_12490 [Operophtera brumata]
MVMDPLKAIHKVRGVSAREMCHYFFNPRYRYEWEIDGMVMDPLKAIHKVREMCHYFFNPRYRHEWEKYKNDFFSPTATLETMTIVEEISPDACVCHQTFKRVWPASQRDALFWSHARAADDCTYAVTNHSTTNAEYPVSIHTYDDDTRDLHDACVCHQTFKRVWPASQRDALFWSHARSADDCTYAVTNHSTTNAEYPVSIHTYDDDTRDLHDACVLNPGGWAPAGVLRAVYKREYPKFLKRFTNYVTDQCKGKPLAI